MLWAMRRSRSVGMRAPAPTSLSSSLLNAAAPMSLALCVASQWAPSFVLTDNPVVRIVDLGESIRLRRADHRLPTEIIMPLSRRMLLLGLLGPRDCRTKLQFAGHDIPGWNTLILARAERFIYTADGKIAWSDQGAKGRTQDLLNMLRARRAHDAAQMKAHSRSIAKDLVSKPMST